MCNVCRPEATGNAKTYLGEQWEWWVGGEEGREEWKTLTLFYVGLECCFCCVLFCWEVDQLLYYRMVKEQPYGSVAATFYLLAEAEHYRRLNSTHPLLTEAAHWKASAQPMM